MNNFQREGSSSNTQVGKDFEGIARHYFSLQGIHLNKNYKVRIGIGATKKEHAFDLGSSDPKILVECKSHKWTTGENTPSAKMTVWNEVMYYFSITPDDYRKILFVLHDYNKAKKETLAEYYIRTYEHLIPKGVEIWEYDYEAGSGKKIY